MKKFLYLIFFALIIGACNDDDSPSLGSLSINLTNLPNLGTAEQYEGWIIVNGSPVSTGTFTIDNNGNLSQSSIDIDAAMLSSATAFVLTIEPIPDNDPTPSNIKILGGDFSANQASLSVSHGAALGDDFTSSTGKYILATPTTTVTTDELSGLWFLDPSGPNPVAGLSLPTLPSNWKYEGWAVINGTPVTSGTFLSVDGVDDDDPYSGSDASGPPFPGEDFVANAPSGLSFPTDLSGMTIVVSIEPSPDNDPAPFLLKPLVGSVPGGAIDHTVYNLENQVSTSFPSGSVTR